jgi:hypothetical protein
MHRDRDKITCVVGITLWKNEASDGLAWNTFLKGAKMFRSMIQRAVAAAVVVLPVSVFASDRIALEPRAEQTVVYVNAGQGGFVMVPIVQNENRTYALTGERSSNMRTVNYRFGQGDVSIQVGR